jgi:uncharacterized delta-60 repeat protein
MATVYHVWLASQDLASKLFLMVRFRRAMKKILVPLVLLLLFALPAAARARGPLDPAFGVGGRVVQGFYSRERYEPTQVKEAPDGRIYALYGGSLLAFRPDGSLDVSFGSEGIVLLRQRFPFKGEVRLAIDSQGRLIVVGHVKAPERDYIVAEEETFLAVAKLLPDGEPDPAFNNGELLVTDLGLPPAADPSWAPDDVHGGIGLSVAGVEVDPRGGIVLTGHRVVGYLPAKQRVLPFTDGFAARIEPDGAVDRDFGDDGVILGFADVSNHAPGLAPDGSLYLAAKAEADGDPRVVVGYDAEGHLDPDFGRGGILTLPFVLADMTVDGRGRLTVSGWASEEGHRELLLARFRRDGRPAIAFGDEGMVKLRFAAQARWGAGLGLISGDRRGGLWVAADWESQKDAGTGARAGFALAHVSGAGVVNQSFGRIRTGFGADTRTALESLLVDRRGRPLLAGTAYGKKLPDLSGLAMARYRPAGSRP